MWTSLLSQPPFTAPSKAVMSAAPLCWLYRLLVEGSHAPQPDGKRPPKLSLDEIEVSLEDFERRWGTHEFHTDTRPEPEIVTKMTEALAHGTLKDMARIFHQTCPGDWDLDMNVALGEKLQAYYERNEGKEHAPMLAATIRFRWEMGLLADYLVSLFGLPIPCNEVCALWHQKSWQYAMEKTNTTWRVRWDKITNALGRSFDVIPREDQGPLFYRPPWYFTAALVEADKSEDEILTIVSAVCEFSEILKEFHYEDYEY
ncbi:uncharacterized protein N7484_001068 [Penicillium longicatenatum]|uniref:uncharacterized protein n=1 Tax=Penicillium longicatenatum TaxID=1561947 RepID=UPI002546A737|nr:uncharacterized protein N7484_001068 [Penicillium longicatenatum]KAJ5657419.1 hypothetical protein N7484_001068 [Penicillium longicatenatum]